MYLLNLTLLSGERICPAAFRVLQTYFLVTLRTEYIINDNFLNCTMEQQRLAVFRKTHFNAAHRLHNPMWSDEQNARIFGKCNNPNYHGHNYELVVRIVGTVNPETGYVMDLGILNNLIDENILQRFDHKNLNLDTAEFKEINPSAENIAIVIYNLLRPKLDDNLDLKIRLYETERNFVEYPA